MQLRLLLGPAIALSTTLLTAQESPPATPPTPAPAQSPAEQIAELMRRVEQLKSEIAFVRERSQLSGQLLRDKLRQRGLVVRSIDAGTNAPAPLFPTPVTRETRRARLLGADELAQLGDDVAMTVDGRPVSQAQLEATVKYLESFMPDADPQGLAMRATLELVRIESVVAEFPEAVPEAQKEIEAAAAELAQGTPWSEVVHKYSRGPLQEDGKVTLTRNNPYGLPLEMAAFATAENKVTGVVKTLTGFAILHVDKKLSGDTKAADRIEGRLILQPYHPDPSMIDTARARAGMGQADVAVRDGRIMEMLPPLYRPIDTKPKADVGAEDGKGAGKPGKQAAPDEGRKGN